MVFHRFILIRLLVLRQGENLSPLLFALFLNDIERFRRQCSTLKYLDRLYRPTPDVIVTIEY